MDETQVNEASELRQRLQQEFELLGAYQSKTRAQLDSQLLRERQDLEQRVSLRRAAIEQQVRLTSSQTFTCKQQVWLTSSHCLTCKQIISFVINGYLAQNVGIYCVTGCRHALTLRLKDVWAAWVGMSIQLHIFSLKTVMRCGRQSGSARPATWIEMRRSAKWATSGTSCYFVTSETGSPVSMSIC